MTSLTYVFHNFIIIYHPFCFRKRVDIFFPLMFLVTFSVIYFNLHFPIMGEGVTAFFLLLGGDYCFFFDNCVRGVEFFFCIWKFHLPPPPPSAIHYECSLNWDGWKTMKMPWFFTEISWRVSLHFHGIFMIPWKSNDKYRESTMKKTWMVCISRLMKFVDFMGFSRTIQIWN